MLTRTQVDFLHEEVKEVGETMGTEGNDGTKVPEIHPQWENTDDV